MVIIKKDPIKEHDLNKEKIDDIFVKFGYDLEKGDNGSTIGWYNTNIARYYYLITCDIYGSSERFMPVAETIEKELGIEVVIYE